MASGALIPRWRGFKPERRLVQPPRLILPHDPRGRRLLVCTGGLRRLQEIPAEPGSVIAENVAVINCCFPEEIVRYYSPGFPDSLLDLMEGFEPQGPQGSQVAQPRRTGSASEVTSAPGAPSRATSRSRAASESIKMELSLPELDTDSRSGLNTASSGVGTRSCVSNEGQSVDSRLSKVSRASRCGSRRARRVRSRTVSRPRPPVGREAEVSSPSNSHGCLLRDPSPIRA